MPVVLRAITPKNRYLPDAKAVKRRLKTNMELYTKLVLERIQVYPPEVPQQRKRRRTQSEQTRLEQQAALEGRELPSTSNRWRRYRRTHKLQRGWKSVVNNDGSEGFVFNTEKYAVFVQGPRAGGGKVTGQKQRRLMRKHGWQSITDVARKTRREFRDLVNRSIVGSPRAGVR